MAPLFKNSVVRYLSLSALSFVLNITLTIGLHEGLAAGEEVAFAAAIATTFFVNFAGLRYYVYPNSSVAFAKQFAGYTAASLIFRVLEFAGFLIVHTWLGVAYQFTAASVLIVSYVAKMLVHRFVVFTTEPTLAKLWQGDSTAGCNR